MSRVPHLVLKKVQRIMSVQNAVGQAVSQIQNSLSGTKNEVTNGVKDVVANAQNTIVNTASNVVANTVKAATGAAISAATNLVTGNISGALSALSPSSIASSALSGVGSSASSNMSLSSPGSFASFSSPGGVNPGDSLAGINARADPLMSFMWYAQLPVINPIGTSQPAPGVSTLSSIVNTLGTTITSALSSALGGSVYTSNSAQLPWYYVEEAQCSFRAFQTMSIFREGRHRHYPTSYDINPLTLHIYADTTNMSFQYLQAWQNAVLAPFSASTQAQTAGGFGRPSDYKKPIYISLLDPSNNTLLILEYVECWPADVAAFTLNSGASDRLVHQVTFNVGDLYINLMSVPPNLTQLIVNNPLSNALTGVINSGVQNLPAAISGLANQVGTSISSIF